MIRVESSGIGFALLIAFNCSKLVCFNSIFEEKQTFGSWIEMFYEFGRIDMPVLIIGHDNRTVQHNPRNTISL